MGPKTAAYAVIALVVAASACGGRMAAAESMTCTNAINSLIPCGSYLIGAGGAEPTKKCCQSVQALNRAAATPADRRTLCECFVQTGPSFGVKPEFAGRLPAQCNLQLKISFDSQDCTMV